MSSVLTLLPFMPVSAASAEQTESAAMTSDDFENVIAEYAQETRFASFQTAVFTADDVIYTGRFGYSDIEQGIRADEQSVYDWGSISKTLVWVSIMQLSEQGKLDLNDDIRTYLPDGFLTRLKYDDPITVLNLMNHQCGWEETSAMIETADNNKILPLDEALKQSEPNQVFRPGEITGYSNWGAALAGYLVECVSGESFSDYVHTSIFDVLGMEHTSIAPDHSDTPWVQERYETMKAYQSIYADSLTPIDKKSFIQIYPAGAAVGTIDDLAAYGRAFLSDPCPLFEKQETLELMLSPTSFFGDSGLVQNCHGFWTSYYGVTCLGHNGATITGSANFVFSREKGTGCVILANQAGESSFTELIPVLLFGDSKENPELTESGSKKGVDISGKYMLSRDVWKGIPALYSKLSSVTIEKMDDGTFRLNDMIELNETRENLFVINFVREGSPVGYAKNPDGRTILSLGSTDLVKAPNLRLEQIMIYGYMILAVLSFILLIVSWIQTIVKRWNSYGGWQFIILSRAAGIVSLAGIVIYYIFLLSYSGVFTLCKTLTKYAEMMCIGCYGVSLLASLFFLFVKRKQNAKPAAHILNIAISGLLLAFSAALQLWIA